MGSPAPSVAFPSWSPDGAILMYYYSDNPKAALASQLTTLGYQYEILPPGSTELSYGQLASQVTNGAGWLSATRFWYVSGHTLHLASIGPDASGKVLVRPDATRNLPAAPSAIAPDGQYVLVDQNGAIGLTNVKTGQNQPLLTDRAAFGFMFQP